MASSVAVLGVPVIWQVALLLMVATATLRPIGRVGLAVQPVTSRPVLVKDSAVMAVVVV